MKKNKIFDFFCLTSTYRRELGGFAIDLPKMATRFFSMPRWRRTTFLDVHDIQSVDENSYRAKASQTVLRDCKDLLSIHAVDNIAKQAWSLTFYKIGRGELIFPLRQREAAGRSEAHKKLLKNSYLKMCKKNYVGRTTFFILLDWN